MIRTLPVRNHGCHGAPTSGLTTGAEGVAANGGLFKRSVMYDSSRLTRLIPIDVHARHSIPSLSIMVSTYTTSWIDDPSEN